MCVCRVLLAAWIGTVFVCADVRWKKLHLRDLCDVVSRRFAAHYRPSSEHRVLLEFSSIVVGVEKLCLGGS